MSSRQFKEILFLCLLAAAPLLVAAGENKQVEGADTGGIHSLFDGQSLAGWHGYGRRDPGLRWQAENGVLSIKEDSRGYVDIVSDGVYENFELILEWKISPGGNSGIMFNVNESKKYKMPWKTGPELQILDDDGHADAKAKHRSGALYDLVEAREAMARPAGEWNESRLQVENGLLQHWLNGTLIIEVQMWDETWNELVAGSKFAKMPGFGKYRSGHIVLQDHGDVVAFRNIRIREL